MSAPESNPPNSVTKRKVIDVVSTLDAAVKETSQPNRATKRRRVSPPISTEALISILKSSNKLPSPKYRTITSPPSYTPTSLSDLVSRLSTYSLTSYSSGKPNSISALSCALLGWKNAGKERLECVTCSKGFIVSSPKTGDWSGPTGIKLALKWESDLRESHEKSCPWKVRGCSRSIYRVKMEGRGDMIRELKKNAFEMEKVGLGMVKVNTGFLKEEDGNEVVKIINSYIDTVAVSTSEVSSPSPPSSLSPTTIHLALFGWNLSPTATPTSLILTCSLCTRRVFANSYIETTSEKTFNLSSSHQAFCPFINSSTGGAASSPSSSTSTLLPEAILGWESRLRVILNRIDGGKGSGRSSTEKFKSGTKELMMYVRELLGPKAKK